MMKNIYNKTAAMATMWLLLLLGFSSISKAQDGITTAFAFGGGMSVVDEMRYASDGNLYFVARLGGKNQFAGNNYDAGGYGSYPLQQWIYGKLSPSGTQTVLKAFERNVDNNNLYNSIGGNHVIDKDGNLYSIMTGTFPGNDYGNSFVETGYGAKLIKTSKTGVVQWVKPINTGVNINYGSSGITLPNVNGMQVMEDGSLYTIIAANYNPASGSNTDKFGTRIIKFNGNGDEIWHHEIFLANYMNSSVTAPKQFVANNGNMMVNITSNSPTIVSKNTTLTAINPTSFGSYYFCLMGLDSNGERTWFHSTTSGASFKAIDPTSGIAYVTYTYSGSNNTPSPIAPYSSLPNLNPIYGQVGNYNYIYSGMLKLDVATGNITNSTPTVPLPNSYRFLTEAEKLHVRSDGTLIFYAHYRPFSAIGDYIVPDNYNAFIFTDANYNVIKVSQSNIAKVELIAENSTNFAFADDFKTAITLGGNTLTPFLIDTDFGTRFPLYAIAKADSYIAQGTISQIGEPKVTKWTGATSTVWNDAGNWSNGIADISTTAIFDANTTNQPTVSAATTVGKLIINSDITATLPASNLTVKDKLIINGTLKFPVASFTSFIGYTATAIEGNGTLQFDGTGTAIISYFGALSQNLNLKTNVALNVTGTFRTLEFIGSSAKITASGTGLTITSTDANAITGASATNYIVGKLTRNIAPSITYNFPVGTSNYYLPATINTNNITGTNSLTAEVKTTNPTIPDVNLGGITASRATNNGWWVITPDAQPTSGTYNITLGKNKATNGDSDASKYLILKTSPAGNLYAFDGSLGNRNQTGGTGSNPNFKDSEITASQNDLESFGDFMIAVMSTPVTQPLAVANSTWTGNTNTEWNNAGNWSNGVPNTTVNATIPSGLTNYPLVYPATTSYLRSLTIEAGVNTNLSNLLSVATKITNNGIITVNTNTNSKTGLPARAALVGTGKVVFEKPQVYAATGSATGNMDCDLDINIGNTNTINLIGNFGGNINIISGLITARDNGSSWFTPTKATSTVQITAPINNIAGRIWKTVTPGSGTYDFPLGNDQYHRPSPADGRKYGALTITNNNITNITQYVVWFDAYYLTPVAVANGTDVITDHINSGQWSVQISGTTSASGTINLAFKTADYTNERATTGDYVLLRKEGSSSVWNLVNGATFAENAGVITATANGLAPIASGNPTKFCIGLKATISTWTGAANNGNWNTVSNWSNGVPTAAVKAVFNGTATNFPTSNIPTSNGAATVEIQSGATLTLPTDFTTPIPMINNGTIEVKGTGAFVGFGSNPYTVPTGSGTLKFTANSPNQIYGAYLTGSAIPNSIEIANPAGVTVYNSSLNLGGSLIFSSGKLTVASGYTLNMTNANATISGASASAYIIGNFNRAVNTSGTYSFPVGSASAYAPATLQLNNITGPTTISSKFTTDAIDKQPNLTIGSGTVNSLLAGGSWEISPSPSLSGGSYDITLSAPLGASTATEFVVLKRPANYYYEWENQGVNQASSINGGMVTASATGLTAFSQFGIGELPAGALPVTLVKFTAKAESNSISLNWETASEQNSDKFIVERSTDGKVFLPVSNVKAKGNSNSTMLYNLRDKTPLNGANYYRLKMVDLDGTFEYSDMIAIEFAIINNSVKIYPNPVSHKLNFNGFDGKTGNMNLYTLNGQKLISLPLVNNEIMLPTTLSDGVYLIKVQFNDGSNYSQKIIVKR